MKYKSIDKYFEALNELKQPKNKKTLIELEDKYYELSNNLRNAYDTMFLDILSKSFESYFDKLKNCHLTYGIYPLVHIFHECFDKIRQEHYYISNFDWQINVASDNFIDIIVSENRFGLPRKTRFLVEFNNGLLKIDLIYFMPYGEGFEYDTDFGDSNLQGVGTAC